MTAPIVIQHPGGGQFLQQGLEQGIGLGQKQQELGLQKEATEAGISAKQQELALQERTVAANEAFRRGYGVYLENRGRYYGAKAEETTAQQQRTQQYINGLTDPDAKQAALLALSDPNLQRALTAQQGQGAKMRALAGNYLLHAGPGTTWAQAEQIFGLPAKPGDEKIKGPDSSYFSARDRGRVSQLGANLARLSATLHQAESEQKSYRDFLSGQALLGRDQKLMKMTPEQLDSTATAHTEAKYGKLDQLRQQLINAQAELTGTLAPHLGQGQNTPAIPDISGAGGVGQSGPQDGDMDIIMKTNQMLEQMSDLWDQQQDNMAGGAGGGF